MSFYSYRLEKRFDKLKEWSTCSNCGEYLIEGWASGDLNLSCCSKCNEMMCKYCTETNCTETNCTENKTVCNECFI